MSQLKLSSLANQAGTEETPIADVIHGSARAWVNFNGTGTVAIRASGNVSSVTDNGVGLYTINLTTALQDVNYSVVITCSSPNGAATPTIASSSQGGPPTLMSASQLRITSNTSASSVDHDVITVAFLDKEFLWL